MDGGVLGNKNWGGGRFSFEFFFQNQSCKTGVLKTDDDNWEKGQINYFVGHQIGSCENFPLDSIGKNTNRISYCTANIYPMKTIGTGNLPFFTTYSPPFTFSMVKKFTKS